MARRVVIVNPQAGSGQFGLLSRSLEQRLRREGMDIEWTRTDKPGHAIEIAAQWASRCDVIGAMGGDGTVNEVANGILQAPTPRPILSILPCGTGNDIATQTGVRSIEDGIQALREGVPHTIDAIEVRWRDGGQDRLRYALDLAAAGFAAEIIRQTTPLVRRIFGQRLCYSIGLFRALLTFSAPFIEVTADGQSFSGPMLHVSVSNAEYAGGGVMRLAPGAQMDDGRLEVCLIESLHKLEVCRQFPRLLKGDHVIHPRTRYFSGLTVSVRANPEVELQLDGDIIGHTPASFRVLPQALRVLAPPRLARESAGLI